MGNTKATTASVSELSMKSWKSKGDEEKNKAGRHRVLEKKKGEPDAVGKVVPPSH